MKKVILPSIMLFAAVGCGKCLVLAPASTEVVIAPDAPKTGRQTERPGCGR